MIRAIIVEDEWYNIEEIADMLSNTESIEVAGKYSNPLVALKEVNKLLPQLAFIDVDMPEMDGITLAERLAEKSPNINIVFITAYDKYAVKAFEVNALDYVMKPINPKRFDAMIEKVKKNISNYEYEVSSEKSLIVKSFGELLVKINGIPVKWGRSKAEELFAFLLMNLETYVHKDVIVDNLWPKYETQKALTILQTTIYKLRKIFAELDGRIEINYSGNKYCMVIKATAQKYVDFIRVKKAIINYNCDNKESFKAVQKAAEIYDEGFLNKQGYLWSIEENEKMKNDIITIMKEIGYQYFIKEKYNSCIKICRSIVSISPCDEKVSIMMLKCYKKLQLKKEMMNYYVWLEKVMENEYDMKPSKAIKDLLRD